jgi:hypothetical protein
MSSPSDPHEAAIRILRESPSEMNESERYARLCMALACDFPDLFIERVLSIATNAMTCWRRSH